MVKLKSQGDRTDENGYGLDYVNVLWYDLHVTFYKTGIWYGKRLTCGSTPILKWVL